MAPDRIDTAFFSPDIREFIGLLHRHAVRYVVVGGEAVIYHDHARLTGDVDFSSAWDTRETVALKTDQGEVWLHYLGIERLIDNEQAAGRPKDIEDLAFLRKVRT
jgi:hypothetical protein